MLAGVLVFRLYSRGRASVGEHDIHVFEEAAAPAGDDYRIMVAVANPDNALELVRNTYKLCQAKQARVELLHMVPVPDQVALGDARQYMLEGREGILETMLYLGPLFPISTHLRYCRNIARGIVSAVREKRINMLILGWHGRRRSRLFHLGSTLDPIIERSPCDVVVFKDCGGNRTFRRILVPVAGGPNGAIALEVASMLADGDDGTITAFTVDTHRRPFGLEAFVEANLSRMHVPSERVRTRRVSARHVVPAILQEAREYDLVVLGCTRRPLVTQIGRHPIPETVARRCAKPLVMVHAGARLRSWIRRWV